LSLQVAFSKGFDCGVEASSDGSNYDD